MDKELAAPVKRHLIMRPKTTGGGGRPLVVVPTIGAAYRPSALMPVSCEATVCVHVQDSLRGRKAVRLMDVSHVGARASSQGALPGHGLEGNIRLQTH